MRPLRCCGAILVALCCLAALLPRAARAAYAQADLAGTWRASTLASGPGEPWWERARAVIATNGDFTAYTIDNFGERDTISAQLLLGATGVVTMPAQAVFHGALDLGRTVFAGTSSWPDGAEAGTAELRVGLKWVGPCTVANIAGDWELNAIASGPGSPWWMRGRMTVASNGALSGTFSDNTGASDPVGGTLSVGADGAVALSFAPLAQGWVDAGRSVLVLTNSWSDGPPASTELSVAVRMAASYVLADLAGTWELHSIGTGPGAPHWSRGQIVVGADGSYSGSQLTNLGGSRPISGSFVMASNGVITQPGKPNARGALDRGHTIMVWTDTWTTGSPGTTELTVAVRTDGSTASVPPEALARLVLEPVRPNPARGTPLTVRFTLPDAGAARLELLDVAGRVIDAWAAGSPGAGAHAVDLSPAARPRPGLYFVRLTQGPRSRWQRVTVLD